MSWSSSVSSAADAMANVVEQTVVAVEEALSDVVETPGNAIEDMLDALGGLFDHVPWIGGFLSGALAWLGGVISAALDVAAAALKSVGAIAGGALAGAIRIAGGILGRNRGSIVEGLGGIASSIAGGLILVGGKIVSLAQTLLFIELPRRLTEAERTLLWRVFRGSLALYNVRLVEGFAGVYSANSRPFALGNTIYLKRRNKPSLLVHECVHVWQFQHTGARYLADALYAQRTLDNAYDWQAAIASGHVDWVAFNNESQAEFLSDLYDQGELTIDDGAPIKRGNGAFYDADPPQTAGRFTANDGADHTKHANDAVTALRRAKSYRLLNFVT